MDDRERWQRLAAAAGSLDAGNDLRVYVELLRRVDHAGEWCGTFADLGDTLGLSWSSVARSFGRLTTGGWVVKVRDLSRAAVWRLRDMANPTQQPGRDDQGDDGPDMAGGRDVAQVLAHPRYGIPPTPPLRKDKGKIPPPPPSPDAVSLTGGGGDMSGVIYQPGNSCYVKLDTVQPERTGDVRPNGIDGSGGSVRVSEPEPADLAARLAALGAVTDTKTREALARRWPIEVIRVALDLTAKARNAREPGAVLVGILRRGVASAEHKRRSERADEAAARRGDAAIARADHARAVLEQNEREKAEREQARARFAAARPADLREALAVAMAELEAGKGKNAARAALHGFNLGAAGAFPAVCVRSHVRAGVLAHLELIDAGAPRAISDAAQRLLTEWTRDATEPD